MRQKPVRDEVTEFVDLSKEQTTLDALLCERNMTIAVNRLRMAMPDQAATLQGRQFHPNQVFVRVVDEIHHQGNGIIEISFDTQHLPTGEATQNRSGGSHSAYFFRRHFRTVDDLRKHLRALPVLGQMTFDMMVRSNCVSSTGADPNGKVFGEFCLKFR